MAAAVVVNNKPQTTTTTAAAAAAAAAVKDPHEIEETVRVQWARDRAAAKKQCDRQTDKAAERVQ